MSVETHPWTYIHPDCGKPAFHRTEIPLYGTPITAPPVEHLNGEPCKPTDPVMCESCGNALDFGLEIIDPDNWRKRVAV